MILVDLDSVTASRPGHPLFTDLSLTVSSGDRIGIVGVNGAGKSTLLRLLAGVDPPEQGRVRRGRGVRVAFLDQRPSLPAGSVADAVGAGWEAAAILDRVGMSHLAGVDVGTLSGGQAKRVALARTLLTDAGLLILDEPTNHLDIAAITWLEERLSNFRGGLVLVTHDRHVLDRVTSRIVEIEAGSTYVHDGGYASYLQARTERAERSGTREATRRNLARAELAWLRRGAKARTRKPQARVAAAESLIAARPPDPARRGDLDLARAGAERAAPRLGDEVIGLVGVGHRFGEEPWLFRGLDLDLERDGRLGIVGPNGSGKSTLLEILAGRIAPTEGAVERGSTVRVGLYDQTGHALDPAQRVREAVAGPTRLPDWEDARLLEQFWFGTDAQWAPIGLLSGGERRRLQLVLVLAARPNVLLLDEPSNDLDLDTLRALEAFLESWPGSLVAVSHDRAFLERTTTDVIALDGRGRAGRVPGGYAAWPASPVPGAARPTKSRPSGTSSGATAPSGSRAPRGSAAPTGPGRSPAPPGRPKARTPSTLRRLIAIAEREMNELTVRRQALAATVTDPGLGYQELAALTTELAAVEERLAAAEERWVQLTDELGA